MSHQSKPRVIVCTDISSLTGGWMEPDDAQSLVRFLLYTNEIDVEGLIATWTQDSVHPEYIKTLVKVYGHIQGQLRQHDSAYPDYKKLMECIKAGSPAPGVATLGEKSDTEGSNWIISAADKPDPRPLWILFWGGPNELAQAIWRVEHDRGKEGLSKFLAKIRVFAIADQDDTAEWIRQKCPSLLYITSRLSFRGMYLGGDESTTGWDWVCDNIRRKGSLGAAYPSYWSGDCFGNKVRGLKEGDTPSFFYVINNGLSDPEKPEWGCWGGRFRKIDQTNHYEDAQDCVDGDLSAQATVYRWRRDYQNDFLARLDWSVKPKSECNHPPVVKLGCDNTVTVKPNQQVTLDASDSFDIDGDELNYSWQVYKEAGSCEKNIHLTGDKTPVCSFVAPDAGTACEIHIVLALTDSGNPPLSRYARVIVNVNSQ